MNSSTSDQKFSYPDCHLTWEKMPKLWVRSNEWLIKYDPFWGVSCLFNIEAMKSWFWSQCLGGQGCTHRFCTACPWGFWGLGWVWALMRVADNSQNAVIFRIHLWFTPVAILHMMYLWAGGWHAARYVSITPTKDFSVSKFLRCDRFTSALHHQRDQYLS